MRGMGGQSERFKQLTCICCTSVPVKMEAPTDHSTVVLAANSLLQAGVVSQEEYEHIVNSDLKYRTQSEKQQQPYVRVKSSGVRKHQPNEETTLRDPITLEPLGKNTYTINLAHGTVTYNLQSLVCHLQQCGSGCGILEPTTRTPLSAEQLASIQSAATAAGIDCKLDVDMDKLCKEKQTRDSVQVYDAVLGELVSEMLAAIEGSANVAGDPDVSIGMLISEFDRIFALLKEADLEAAHACLSSYIAYLYGPQTKPTKPGHTLRQAVRMLQSQWTPQDNTKLMAVRAPSQEAQRVVAEVEKVEELSEGLVIATQTPETIQA